MPSAPASAPALVALAALALVAILSLDTPRTAPTARSAPRRTRSACEGARTALPDALYYELRAAAFPGSGGPDVAVHVPPGFDGTRRPGLIVYFHGWNGCVAAALSAGDAACGDGGAIAAGANLAAQVDEARVNALLVAIEVRAGMPTGEPGRLAMPAGLRGLLRELFAEHLDGVLGCALDVDALDRVAIVAHSGGYQAAAGALEVGDVPRIAEVDLLDALYGGDDTFARWIDDRAARFDPRAAGGLRFVDLYTCCGGTDAASRALARRAGAALAGAGLARALYDDDGDAELDPAALAHPVVFKRVPREHPALPGAYVRALLEASGFARLDAPEETSSHSLPPN